jgi:poly(hydroxyalkanoate) granule-associated protein
MATKRKPRKSAGSAKSAAQERMLEAMNQIWLAGLGALSKARKGTPQMIDELAAEGARVQADTRGAAEKALGGLLTGVKTALDSNISQVRDQTKDALEGLEAIFQTRVRRALTQLGVPSAEDIEELSRRVDRLNDSVRKLGARRKPAARVRKLGARRKPAAGHAARKANSIAHAAAS